MKKLTRLFLLDIRKGLLFQWKRITVSFLLIAVLLVLNESYITYVLVMGSAPNSEAFPLTFADLLLSLFAGIDFYYPGSSVPFSLPVAWVFLILMAMYLVLDFPLADLNSVGSNFLVVSSSRNLWWLSKCLWVVLSILVFCIIVFLAAVFVTLLSGGVLSFDVHSEIPQIISFDVGSLREAPWDIGRFLFSIPALLIALALVQLFLSLAIRPVPSFACVAVLLFLSAYYNSNVLIGEYLMAARSSVFVLDGFSPEMGTIFAGVVGLWAMLFGMLFFGQRDVFGKDQG